MTPGPLASGLEILHLKALIGAYRLLVLKPQNFQII
jgi:hypothetical protein